MSDATDFQPNPKELPTFKSLGSMPSDTSVNPFRDGAFMGLPSFDLQEVIVAVEGAGHTMTGLQAEPGDERAVFSVFPGLGGAVVQTTPHDFIVFAHHPAMGDSYEIHVCENAEQVLAVLATVSYG